LSKNKDKQNLFLLNSEHGVPKDATLYDNRKPIDKKGPRGIVRGGQMPLPNQRQ